MITFLQKIQVLLSVFFLCLGFCLLFPVSVHAAIILSEIYPAPATGETEWVEIFNTGPETVTLNNWILKDQLSTPSVIFTFSSQVLSPGNYYVADLPSAKLNNTSDGVTLFDASGQTIDTMSYTTTESVKSWQRSAAHSPSYVLTTSTKGTANSEYLFVFSQSTPSPSATPTPTTDPQPTNTPTPTVSSSPTPSTSPSPSPSATPTSAPFPSPTSSPNPSPTPTITPTPSPTPSSDYSKIQLSEIMACPSSSSEWLELYNGGNTAVEIKNWKVTDESGNTKTLAGSIPAQGWQVFYWTGSLLNNSGDSLTITTEFNQVLAQAEYTDCTIGFSLIFSEQGSTKSWLATIATPGEKNATPKETATDSTTSSSSTTSATTSQTLLTPTKKTANEVSTTVKNAIATSGKVLGKFISAATNLNFQSFDLSVAKTTTPSAERKSAFITKNNTIAGAEVVEAITGGILTIGSSLKLLYKTKNG